MAKKNKEQFIKDLMSKMTLGEKAGQLTMCGNSIYGNEYEVGWDMLRDGHIGSFLTITSVERANELQRVAVNETRLGIPVVFGFDVIHGLRTMFPLPYTEACGWDPELAKKTAAVAAKEARANGIHWTFAPMVDVARDARWGRSDEGAGEDTYLHEVFAKARVEGFQGDDISSGDHVAACAKHFVGYGAAIGGLDYNSVDMSEQNLYNFYLPPFVSAINAGVRTVMSAFHDLNGEPCTGSHYVLTELLRDRLGFKGVVTSDASSVVQVKVHGFTKDDKDTAKTVLSAGCDIEMDGIHSIYDDWIEELANEGSLDMDVLDTAVERVLSFKYDLGLFENPFFDEEKAKSVLLSEESVALSKEAALNSIVLLENKNNTLPLKNDVKIAVIGPMGNDGANAIGDWGTAWSRTDDTVTIVQGLKNGASDPENITYAFGCDYTGTDGSQIADAVKVAEKADVIVAALGECGAIYGEARSRCTLNMPGMQLELLRQLKKLGKPIVTISVTGRPIVLTEVAELSDALISTGSLGTQSGNAYADVLFGKFNPCGKTVMTLPKDAGTVPLYYNHNNTGKPSLSPEDVWVTKYVDGSLRPLYPFGYGKSYTKFKYSNLKAEKAVLGKNDTLKVSVDIENCGDFDGTEIVQLYIRDLVSSIVRPVKELKGFKKVKIKKGEKVTVDLSVDVSKMGFYNRKLEYVVEPGDFAIMVGENSDSYLETTVTIE